MSLSKNLRMSHSAEAISDKMSIFTVPPTDISCDEKRMHIVSNKNPLTDDVVLFEFETSDGYMAVLDEIEMEITGKLVTGSGATLPAMPSESWTAAAITTAKKAEMQAADVFPINQLLHSMFRHGRVRIQDQYMDTNEYHMKAMLDTILGDTYGNAERKLGSLYVETSGSDGSKYSMITGHPKSSISGASLGGMTKLSSVIQMRGRLPLDMCSIDKFMLSRVKFSIELFRNSPDFYLMSSKDDASFKFVTSECKLYVPIVKVRSDVDLANSETLKTNPAYYPYEQSVVKTYTVTSGSHTFAAEDLFQGRVPLRTVVCMVPSTNYSPGYKHWPFYFKHFNVSEMKFKIDDVISTLTMKFSDEERETRALQPYLALTNMYPALELSLPEFVKDSPLFVFDNASDFEPGTLPMQKKGLTRLEMKFDTALTENITVFIYSKLARVIQITNEREVVV
jgi:hypothetical protein